MKKAIIFFVSLLFTTTVSGQSVFGFENGHEWVDLGLSVKWATQNVGASTINDSGSYFAWGEVKPNNEYSWSTYKWCKDSFNSLNKYNTIASYGIVDNETSLNLSDDVARVSWGKNWRMPTKTEYEELLSNCSYSYKEINGEEGVQFVSRINGQSIFFPAAGGKENGVKDFTAFGFYWSSSLSPDFPHYAWGLYFISLDGLVIRTRDYARCCGLTIRPVCDCVK